MAIWQVVTPTNLENVMNKSITAIGAKVTTQGAAGMLPMVANRVRGAIRSGGRVPLDVTDQAVPPEAVQHVCVLAVFALCAAQPGLLVKAQDERDSFDKMVRAAEDFITECRNGMAVTAPDAALADPLFVSGVAGSLRKVDVFSDDGPCWGENWQAGNCNPTPPPCNSPQ